MLKCPRDVQYAISMLPSLKIVSCREHESQSFVKDDTLHSFKKFCILSENVIFQVATLPVEPFGTQSPSKFQHFTSFGQKLTDATIWSTILSPILITIIVAERCFCNTYECVITAGVEFVCTVLQK